MSLNAAVIGLGSFGSRHIRTIQKLGLGKVSAIVTRKKSNRLVPDAAIYRTALEQTGIAADETLFIDDNRPNTDAAERVGIHAWHLAAPTTIHDLFE